MPQSIPLAKRYGLVIQTMFYFHPKPEVKHIWIGKAQGNESMLTKISLIFQTIETIWILLFVYFIELSETKTSCKEKKTML